jgi:putative aldouronate transport system substrate-binding protein
MRKEKRTAGKALRAMVAVGILSIFTGCGPGKEASQSQSPSAGGGGKVNPETGLFKYDPPIEVKFGKWLDVNADSLVRMEKDGEPYDNNRWIKYFRDDVGVESKYHLTATGDYGQKLLMAMSANDLPDIFSVYDLSQLKQLADAGSVVDLTDSYKTYANDTLREVLEFEGKEIFNPVSFNGHMYAIPVKMPSTNGYNHCWVRQDWLDELGLARPKTMDDVKAIAKAFKQKSSGNIGLMLGKDYLGEAKGIFWAFGGQPSEYKYWSTLTDGSVGFSEVQPEMKGGLAWLRDMYAEGLISQEFSTQDVDKAFEYVADNKCGIFFAPHWYGIRLYAARTSLDPQANFVAVGLPAGTGQPTRVYASNTFDGGVAVRADFPHPEALVHLYNAYEEKLFGKNNDFDNFFFCETNDGLWNAGPIHALHPMVDLAAHRDISAAVANGTTDQLTGVGKSFWNYITSGQRSFDYMFGPKDSCFSFVDATYPDIIVWNGYIGAPTETWADRWSSLREIIDTTYLKIIQGQIDLDTGFDNMVKEWNALGGAQITKEVNAIVSTY